MRRPIPRKGRAFSGTGMRDGDVTVTARGFEFRPTRLPERAHPPQFERTAGVPGVAPVSINRRDKRNLPGFKDRMKQLFGSRSS